MKRKKILFFKTPRLTNTSVVHINIPKRQRFVIAVLLLSSMLFITENVLGKSGFYVAIVISLLSAGLFFLSVFRDIKDNHALYVYILPVFLFTMSFGLFYFLLPSRLLARGVLTILYAFGLYSLFLSQNIFIVSSLRTIQLVSGARIASFVITVLSYFLLTTVIFSLRLPIFAMAGSIAACSFIAVFQSIAVTYEKSLKQSSLWAGVLSLALLEVAILLWFWPAQPTLLSIFLTGFFYTIVGLTHVWMDRRLFRGVIWGYIWVTVVVFLLLITFTAWKG